MEADIFEELVEPVEAAAHVIGAAAGVALVLALTHPTSALQPRPFYFLLALATGVAAALHTLRKLRAGDAESEAEA